MKKTWNMTKTPTLKVLSFTGLGMLLFACNPDSPGVEYMPDMYRSPSVETYVDYADYGNNEVMSAKEPVAGTVPRGFMPYSYPNTLEGYEMAGQELVNPMEENEKNLADGKALYTMMCKHCHGANGDGKGSITNPVYGAVPSYADLTPNRRGNRAMKDLRAGHIYHTIMFGLNAMGSHASQINEEERWKIVMFVQTMQGNKKEAAATVMADATAAGSTN
jgi:mono/diheme cytochrome c family protein